MIHYLGRPGVEPGKASRGPISRQSGQVKPERVKP